MKDILVRLRQRVAELEAPGTKRKRYRVHLEELVGERTAELKALNWHFREQITERKRMAEALRESEEFRSHLLANSPYPIAVITPDTSIRYVNPALEKLTGFSSAELIGRKPPYPYWTEETLQRTSGNFEGALAKGTQRVEELFQRKNGERFWVEITSEPIIHNREFKYYLSNWVDITERKRAEEALRIEKERFQTLVDEFPIGISVINKDGHYQYVNPMFTELFGYSLKDIPTGREWFAKAFPDQKYRNRVISAWIADEEESEHGELRAEVFTVTCKDGSEKVIKFSGVTLGGENQLVTYEDITERRRAEEREKRLQQELYLSSRLASVGELAAGVAHEINNPLTGILGFSQRLLRKTTDEEVSRDLERIHNEAQRAAKVVENLLTFARRREPKKEYLDINEIVQKALELRAYELKTGNIEVALDLAPSLPEIMVDFHQIQEIFLNIIVNAEQVMIEAHGGGKLTIKTGEIEDYIRISFTDDGPGMPAEHLDKVFDPFFTTRGERGGTGLGLSICHGIVAEHGGRIYARSKAGKGATFLVQLPLTLQFPLVLAAHIDNCAEFVL